MEFRLLKAIEDRVTSVPNRSSRGEQVAIQKPLTSPVLNSGSLNKHRLNPFDKIMQVSMDDDLFQTAETSSISGTNSGFASTKRAEKRSRKQEALEELYMIDLSNSMLKKNIRKVKNQIRHKPESIDVTIHVASQPNYSKKHRMDNTIKTINFIKHNKQTFFNFRTRSYRPVADSSWNKAIHMTPRLQRTFNQGTPWIEQPEKIYPKFLLKSSEY